MRLMQLLQLMQTQLTILARIYASTSKCHPEFIRIILSSFCHPERSEGSLATGTEILRFAQDDKRKHTNLKFHLAYEKCVLQVMQLMQTLQTPLNLKA